MNKDIEYLMAMSCVLPAIAGLWRYRDIEAKYHPFIFMILLDIFIETFLYKYAAIPVVGKYPFAVLNLYMLLNFFLFLLLVKRNDYLSRNLLFLVLTLAGAIGIINFIYNGNDVSKLFYYLLCFVSAAMLIISINILSRQIMEIRIKLVNNFWFWFSSFSILYNAMNLLIFGLYFFALSDTKNGAAIGDIQHFTNVACNIGFIIAILKIPVKRSSYFQPVKAASKSV